MKNLELSEIIITIQQTRQQQSSHSKRHFIGEVREILLELSKNSETRYVKILYLLFSNSIHVRNIIKPLLDCGAISERVERQYKFNARFYSLTPKGWQLLDLIESLDKLLPIETRFQYRHIKKNEREREKKNN